MNLGARWLLAVGFGAWLVACGDGVIGEVSSNPLPGDQGQPGAEPPDGSPGSGPVLPTNPPTPAVPPVLPKLENWQFFGRAEGAPSQVFGASADAGGNLWVAGGSEGLFLLPYGGAAFRRFTIADGLTPYRDPTGNVQQPVISVAGAESGSVFIGYKGVFGGEEANDPLYMVKSGDADKVSLTLSGIEVVHLDIATFKGTPGFPQGREEIRDVYRIVYNRATGDAWFGGNHGVAMYDARLRKTQEHLHAHIMGYLPSAAYTLLSGDWKGIALDAKGDLWMGGGYRVAKERFATSGRQFYALQPRPYVDVWPDQNPSETGTRPEERTDDFVEDLAVAADGSVWVGSIRNGLARVLPNGDRRFIREQLVDPKVTALEVDAQSGAVWVGSLYGGLTRLDGDSAQRLDANVLGSDLIQGPVTDIQSDLLNGSRRILVSFGAGAVGVYTGQ